MFDGEIRDQVLEMLQNQLSCVKKDTRKEHILLDILESNESTGTLNGKRTEIKRILKRLHESGRRLKKSFENIWIYDSK